ncbi:MAG: hypothetical protein Tsb009_14410 [Planctomycetaceae bacterium]
MMRSKKRSQPRWTSVRRRNLVAILISFAAVSLLYFQFDPTPAGGDIGEEAVDIDGITADIDIPTGNGSGAGGADSESGGGSANSLKGKTALLMNVMLLERGLKKFENVNAYTATFYKRERVNGKMLDGQVMKLKMRHHPLSVYMKWEVGDKGRELLYVAGQHDGNMIVKLGGVKRLIPALKLDPTGSTAMEESRHPVTEMGVIHLAKTLIDFRKKDLARKSGVSCRMFDNQTINDRDCFCFVIDYESKSVGKEYRKSVVFVDKESCLPICVKNFTWPEDGKQLSGKKLDKDTLIEDYRYSGIRTDRKLADADFSRSNSNYRLRR